MSDLTPITNQDDEPIVVQAVMEYLDLLRDSGAVNMFGAEVYVARHFDVTPHDARTLVLYWMEHYGRSQ